jgi:hypothetical protein
VIGERPGQQPFREHVELLQLFLAHRDPIIQRIQELLNAQRKPLDYLTDAPVLSRHFEDCFYTLAAVTRNQSSLRGQLQESHWSGGFRPRVMPGVHNDLVDPAQMMIRGFHFWQQTRWPGRNGRIRYAHTLFNLYLLRCLELLSMRLWDAGSSSPGDRLVQLQDLLDALWTGTPADQPVFVRQACWLIPLAHSPTTDELAAYFAVAKQVAETLSPADRLEIQKASVQMAGGHLRSQLRHYCIKHGVSLEEQSLVLNARNSNALDFAMTIQWLVPLLEAYEHAIHSGERRERLELAGAICQGISPDPELFVNRLELLGPYSMIEDLFIAADLEGRALYTSMGQRHLQFLHSYAVKIKALAKPLYDDLPHFKPIDGRYSPYGVIYGFSSNLMEHMALKTLQPGAVPDFSLEDVFVDADARSDKLDWVSGWRKLPHIKQEVQRLFNYPQQFAAQIFDQIEQALRRRAVDGETIVAAQTGRLIIPEHDPQSDSKTAQIPDLPVRYIGSSDARLVAAHQARPYDEAQLLHDRQEGMFIVSYQTANGWIAISKDILTEVLGAGCDMTMAGLPRAAAGVLRLMCPDMMP